MPANVSAAWLNSLTREQKIEFLKSDFSRRMHEWAASHVSYFWWVRTSLLGTTTCRNGSVFFVKIGDRVMGVTAAHVYRGFLKDKEKSYPQIVCRIENLQINPEDRLCGLGTDSIDIATFELTWDELKSIGKQPIVVDALDWPPPHPFEGQTAFLVGFPGRARLWLDPHTISFGLCIGMQPIGTAADHTITCPFEREYWVDTTGYGRIPPGFDLGGISGGPLLLPIERDGAWTMSLGGVISEAPSRDIETVVAVPAHFIAADGTMNPRSMPIRFASKAAAVT
jgi:hypothetical protein